MPNFTVPGPNLGGLVFGRREKRLLSGMGNGQLAKKPSVRWPN